MAVVRVRFAVFAAYAVTRSARSQVEEELRRVQEKMRTLKVTQTLERRELKRTLQQEADKQERREREDEHREAEKDAATARQRAAGGAETAVTPPAAADAPGDDEEEEKSEESMAEEEETQPEQEEETQPEQESMAEEEETRPEQEQQQPETHLGALAPPTRQSAARIAKPGKEKQVAKSVDSVIAVLLLGVGLLGVGLLLKQFLPEAPPPPSSKLFGLF